MKPKKGKGFNKKYLEIEESRVLIMGAVMILYSVILCFDCYRRGVPKTANLAFFDAVTVSITLPVFVLNMFAKYQELNYL